MSPIVAHGCGLSTAVRDGAWDCWGGCAVPCRADPGRARINVCSYLFVRDLPPSGGVNFTRKGNPTRYPIVEHPIVEHVVLNAYGKRLVESAARQPEPTASGRVGALDGTLPPGTSADGRASAAGAAPGGVLGVGY
jgi:hypothetical protein